MSDIINTINSIIDQSIVTALSIESVNHDPHPYVVGPNHIAKNQSMYLGKEQIEEMERKGLAKCYHPGCRVPFNQHKSDKVLFLQLQRNCSDEEIQAELKKLVDHYGETNKEFDGFGFVDTKEKYRINTN